MLKSIALWAATAATAMAADGSYSAITSTDAALRAAPSVDAVQLSVVPSQTSLDVTICFHEGAYCHVTGPSLDGYVAGDLLTIAGEQSTVLDAEKARWALMEENRQGAGTPDLEASDIVVWGDSLSNSDLGQVLARLLPGRLISMQGVAGESGDKIADRMLADRLYDGRFKVIWDRHYTNERTEAYLADIARMVEKAAATGDFIVVSDIRQLVPGDNIRDPAADAATTAANNLQLAKLYPGNFVDVTSLLESPDTRRDDGLHLNDAGNKAVAQALARAIEARSPMASSKPDGL